MKKIVTSCPHCVKTIGHDYLMMGYEVETVHSAALVEELTRDMRHRVERARERDVSRPVLPGPIRRYPQGAARAAGAIRRVE